MGRGITPFAVTRPGRAQGGKSARRGFRPCKMYAWVKTRLTRKTICFQALFSVYLRRGGFFHITMDIEIPSHSVRGGFARASLNRHVKSHQSELNQSATCFADLLNNCLAGHARAVGEGQRRLNDFVCCLASHV